MNKLDSVYDKVDYIITHCCSSEMEEQMGFHDHDRLTDFFDYIEKCVDFKHWYFGHYHRDTILDDKHQALYYGFEKINEREYLKNNELDLEEREFY